MWILIFLNPIISISYYVNSGAAFAPKDANESRLSAAFFVSESSQAKFSDLHS